MKLDLKSTSRVSVICAAIVGITMAWTVLVNVVPATAQAADTKAQQPVTLNFESGDINAVLKTLFNDIGANFSIDPDVHGTVTISMSNVGFLAALRSVMRANNPPLTFEYVDGVYHVRLKQKMNTNSGGGGNGPANRGQQLRRRRQQQPRQWWKCFVRQQALV